MGRCACAIALLGRWDFFLPSLALVKEYVRAPLSWCPAVILRGRGGKLRNPRLVVILIERFVRRSGRLVRVDAMCVGFLNLRGRAQCVYSSHSQSGFAIENNSMG